MATSLPENINGVDRDTWNEWRRKNISITYDFTRGYDFSGQDLSDWNFKRIVFTECNFSKCQMGTCALDEAVFINCTAIEAAVGNLKYIKLNRTWLSDTRLPNGILFLDYTEVGQGGFRDTKIQKLSCIGARFDRTEFSGCTFHQITAGSSLAHCVFKRCEFKGCSFREVDLRGALFTAGTRLSESDLTGADVGEETSLSSARLDNCRIDRHTLEMLGTSGINPAQARQLEVVDPVTKMRLAFSGLMRTIHFIALALFLLPYVAFLVESYVRSRISQPVHGVPLYLKLYRFATTGGMFGQIRWDCVAILVFLLIYNGLRAILVFKTNALEMEQTSTNRVPRFLLEGRWRVMFVAFEIGFVLNVALVLYHTFHFMKVLVP